MFSTPRRSSRFARRCASRGPVMEGPFQRLAIVNRGEPAMRADPRRPRVERERRCADHVDRPLHRARAPGDVRAGGGRGRTASIRDRVTGGNGVRSANGYLDLARARAGARRHACRRRLGGLGLRRRASRRSRSCASDSGVVFVGPDARAMRLLGDKIAAKRLAEKAGLPVAPWSGGPVEDDADAVDQARADWLSAR